MEIKLRRGLALAVIFISAFAHAESPQMTLQSLHSMEQAQRERANLCSKLQANPRCSGFENLLRSATGMTTATCQAQLRSNKCDRLFSQFPKYRDHAMKCEPAEICRLSLEATMAEGCKRYGIEVKDDFMSFLSSEASCLTQWQCLARSSFSNFMAVLNPGQFFASKGQQMAAATIQSFHDDRAKLERASCLDPETQAQLYCYLGVKYGGMVLGGAGAVRAAGAGLMARMGALEADLTADAAVVAETSRAPKIAPSAPAFNAETRELAEYIRTKGHLADDFHLANVNGKGVLTINYLSIDDTRLLALMTKAVRSGGIAEIDAGTIAGPKVLHVLTRLKTVANANSELRIEGTLNPLTLDERAMSQIRGEESRYVGHRWSAQDIANYDQAYQTLRIADACKRLFGSRPCGKMRFSLDARRPESATWTKAP